MAVIVPLFSRFLLDTGRAHIRMTDREGKSALVCAVLGESIASVKILLDAGAPVDGSRE
jgi:ankyrin repeat protein